MSKPQFWSDSARLERAVRKAMPYARAVAQAEDAGGYWDLVRAILEQAIADLRTGRQADLEDAVLYLAADGGELVRWHADCIGIDIAALRQRAQRILAERLGPEDAARLWARCAPLAGGQRRGRAA